jgi:hypothetical protein
MKLFIYTIYYMYVVTLLDLKSTKPDNVRNVKDFCEATQAALSGNDKYGNQKLSCNIKVNEQNAKVLNFFL